MGFFSLQPQPTGGGFSLRSSALIPPIVVPPGDGYAVRPSRLYVVSDKVQKAPVLKESFDPDDIDTIWFAWDNILLSSEIANSEFILPAGWSSVGTRRGVPVSDINDVEYTKANSVTLTTSLSDGLHHIVNRITTNAGDRLDRGVFIRVSKNI